MNKSQARKKEWEEGRRKRISPMQGKHFSKIQSEKQSISHLGESNGNWKGDEVGHSAIHRWVRWHKGRPKKCVWCGKESDKRGALHWSNIDHKYKRDLDDYISLCPTCHSYYDKTELGVNRGRPKK